LQAISALGYKSAITQPAKNDSPSSSSNEACIVALIITDILNPFFSEVVRGVEDEAGAHHFAMQLSNTGENPAFEKRVLTRLVDFHVAGIIACASRLPTQDLVSVRDQLNIPMVVINRRIEHPGISCITINFEDAASRAVQHLLDLGHTRIGYLAGRAATESSLARQRGLVKTLAAHHLPLPPAWCPASYPNIEGGFQAMSSLLELPEDERPTAVVAYNDLLAIGALRAVQAYSLRVPRDISVVGFDGIMMAEHSSPPLTTIDQPKYNLGKLAMRQLRQMIEGQLPKNSYILLDSPLIVRESTAPCKTVSNPK